MKIAILAFVVATVFGTFHPAQAAEKNDSMMKQIYDSARNNSGLIKFCADKGYLKEDSTDNVNKLAIILYKMPGDFDKSDGNRNEALGRKGEVLVDGKFRSLESNLPSNLTLEEWCGLADQHMREGLKHFESPLVS